jgi:hypothetical protein
MNIRTLSCPIPNNLNPLSPNGYTFSLQRLPSLTYFCQEIALPSITLPEVTQLNPFAKVPIAGDQVEFDTLRVQFLVDENMENYKAIHNWIIGLGFPENYQQYTDAVSSEAFNVSEVAGSSSDATLVILGNSNQPIQTVQFVDCIPESLETITFSSINQDVQYLIGTATFKYSYYKFI